MSLLIACFEHTLEAQHATTPLQQEHRRQSRYGNKDRFSNVMFVKQTSETGCHFLLCIKFSLNLYTVYFYDDFHIKMFCLKYKWILLLFAAPFPHDT